MWKTQLMYSVSRISVEHHQHCPDCSEPPESASFMVNWAYKLMAAGDRLFEFSRIQPGVFALTGAHIWDSWQFHRLNGLDLHLFKCDILKKTFLGVSTFLIKSTFKRSFGSTSLYWAIKAAGVVKHAVQRYKLSEKAILNLHLGKSHQSSKRDFDYSYLNLNSILHYCHLWNQTYILVIYKQF